jgi:hypothetical protein
MGAEPIDEQTRAAHLRRIAAAGDAVEPRRRRFVWAGIAGAAVVGFLAGSTGLAMADALPDPAQGVAHDVLHVVQVDVPQGKDGKRGPCVAEAAKIKDKDAKKAAKDACPKGGGDESSDDSGDVESQGGEAPATPEQGPPVADACHGRPPWAGPMSKEQREAAKASASRAQCPKDADESDESTDAADTATTIESTVTASTAPAAPTEPTVTVESSSGG